MNGRSRVNTKVNPIPTFSVKSQATTHPNHSLELNPNNNNKKFHFTVFLYKLRIVFWHEFFPNINNLFRWLLFIKKTFHWNYILAKDAILYWYKLTQIHKSDEDINYHSETVLSQIFWLGLNIIIDWVLNNYDTWESDSCQINTNNWDMQTSLHLFPLLPITTDYIRYSPLH